MLKKMILSGALAKKFGKVHQFHVADLNEMLRAMCSQVPGFKKYLSNAHIEKVRFAFYSAGKNISLEEFDMSSGATEYRMTQVIEGSKQAGVLQIVIGAVALVAAFFTAGASLAAWGAMLGATTATGLAVTALTSIGISMMLGGVVSMLTPQPSYNIGSASSTDNQPNYAFGSPVNTVAMGYPVPILYGRREIGGAIISAGIFSSDQQ
ncbi:Phage tail assembly protein I [Pantoea sp. AS-PWVM4]|uniref:tail assembly protein n=1 Tax=Pantoea sp. AS-PWVM4 TaxID=1332069 RepID=UPI0003AC8635|nr:tail assembly protein [Pantoea sp. AS-PWVM4]ERK18623.1 Phage tail assembly protein I [Pantoea sp. AS-PWVM4]